MTTLNVNSPVDTHDHVRTSSVTPAEDARTVLINNISWGAVIAGVVVALALTLILNMLGVGIGVSTLDVYENDNPTAGTFSTLAAIWWTLSGIIASYAGGYIASRLSGRPKTSTGEWHGLTSWALTTLLLFYLLTTSLAGLAGGIYNSVSGAVGGLGRGASSAISGQVQSSDLNSSIERQLREATGISDANVLRDLATSLLRSSVTGDQAQMADTRERAASALATSQNISIEAARTRIAQYEQQYRETVEKTKQQALQVTDATAKAISRGALLGSLALAFGALAGWFGGRAGTVNPTVTTASYKSTL